MKSRKILLNIAGIFCLMVMSQVVKASCTIGKTSSTTNVGAVDRTVTTSMTARSKLGGPIGLPKGPGLFRVSCTGSYLYFYQRYSGTLTSSGLVTDEGKTIYKTTIPGVGMTLQATSGAFLENGQTSLWTSYSCGGCHDLSALSSYSMQLYIIDPTLIVDGVYTITGVITGTMNDINNSNTARFAGSTILRATVTIAIGSCITPDIEVQLGKHAASDFPAVGSASGLVPFNIEINNCSPGMNAVSYTLRPLASAGVTLVGSGAGQYLTLDQGSTASGVGVQVFYGAGSANPGSYVPFDTKITAPASGGQYGYDKTARGSFVIPMAARYVRTGAITAGTANSAAEFVMAYE